MLSRIATILTWCGMLLVLAGIFIPVFTGPHNDWFKYIFGAGAILNLVGRLLSRYDGDNIRVKRLLRIETWAALFFGAATYFMFTDPDPRSWIVFVLAGGAIMVYTSIMIPRTQRRDSVSNHKNTKKD